MESWAPASLAEDWDRVGLMTGAPDQTAESVWVALELTSELVDRAIAQDVDMVLTHHPPIFSPLDNLRSDNPAAALPLMAAAGGLALFAAHTNLDSAVGGVNDVLAHRLGLSNLEPLTPAGAGSQVKLVTFVPPDSLENVTKAMFAAGAGRIGQYQECAFTALGQGSFLAPQGANPHVGEPGARTKADELRLETIVPRTKVDSVVRALKESHPYEELAYDLYPLDQPPAGAGLGRVGDLDPAQEGGAFLRHAAAELNSVAARYGGNVPATVKRVAVVGGSGGDMVQAAASAGAQVLVTGEASHHVAQQAEDLGICLAVLGHYETEMIIVEPWAELLGQMLQNSGLVCHVQAWHSPQPPWRTVGNLG